MSDRLVPAMPADAPVEVPGEGLFYNDQRSAYPKDKLPNHGQLSEMSTQSPVEEPPQELPLPNGVESADEEGD